MSVQEISSTLKDLVKRARKYRPVDVASRSGLSLRTVTYLFAGNEDVTWKTVKSLGAGIQVLDNESAMQKKNSGNTDKKQRPSRDTGKGSVRARR